MRFAKHKSGKKASRLVTKHGKRLRPEFYLAVNPMTHEEAVALEKKLAVRLKRAGYPTWQN
jgi:geranylgeranyl pyrophosphate synthase